MAGEGCRKQINPKSHFDPKFGFRTTKLAKGRILIGCPVGRYNEKTGKCRGTAAYEILLKSDGGSCKAGYGKKR
jgi:hypothetical protein